MKKISLKRNNRPKALLGADGAIMAAATLAAAGIGAAATAKAARDQAKAVTENAKTQAQSIKAQTENNNQLQQESIAFTREQNNENRQQQANIQTTLQMLAGQQNLNNRLEASRVAVKYGGRPKLTNMIPTFYGGANMPFTVTDGGGVIPLQVDNNGYGLYEIFGNDHNHYHKTKNGKYKTGVGFKFANGGIVEGEGNQNSNKGEKLLVTPTDAMFISKHSINGFNPSEAVDKGMNPVQAFNYQEQLKNLIGINSDGSKKKHRSIRNISAYGNNIVLDAANISASPFNNNAAILGTAVYANSPVEDNINAAKCGKHIKLRNGGRVKAKDGWWQQNAGSVWSGAGNVVGAGINALGSIYAGNVLSDAYNKAGNILADAYGQMRGIDMNELRREDYAAPHTLAVIRSANINVAPQLERLRRNAMFERQQANRNTLSSAARQQKLAGIDDRMYERMGEVYSDKANREEAIKQQNAERIQQSAEANAARDVQANQQHAAARLNLLQYNNNIENSKIAGRAQSIADAMTQSAQIRSDALVNSMTSIGAGLQGAAQGFADSYSANRKAEQDYQNVLIGADTQAKIDAIITRNDIKAARRIYDSLNGSTNPNDIKYRDQLSKAFKFF